MSNLLRTLLIAASLALPAIATPVTWNLLTTVASKPSAQTHDGDILQVSYTFDDASSLVANFGTYGAYAITDATVTLGGQVLATGAVGGIYVGQDPANNGAGFYGIHLGYFPNGVTTWQGTLHLDEVSAYFTQSSTSLNLVTDISQLQGQLMYNSNGSIWERVLAFNGNSNTGPLLDNSRPQNTYITHAYTLSAVPEPTLSDAWQQL